MMENKKQLEVRIDHGKEAFYSNAISVIHSPAKFIINFKQTTPRLDTVGNQKKQVIAVHHKSIILDPDMAKIFLNILRENIGNYEKKFGKIELPKKQVNKGETVSQVVENDAQSYIG